MHNLNYIFFEEFKRLDKLCGEIYNSRHGVTDYIDDMKSVPKHRCQYIPNWKNDMEQLMHLRHIRNYLAHTSGAFQEELCTQKDIDLVIDFYNRILTQTDPMALLYKKEQKCTEFSVPKSVRGNMETSSEDMHFERNQSLKRLKRPKEFKGWGIICFGIALAVLILIIFVGLIYVR